VVVNFPNQAQKATQAVARLIETSGGPIDYLRISKLIYLADRESIIHRGIPIVGGHYFSMRKGPTISEVMNFVNRRSAPEWKETISPRMGNTVGLKGVTSFKALAESEIGILDSTVTAHLERTTDDLVQWCHDNCPEYEEVPNGGRKTIEVEAILQAVHKSPAQIQKVIQNAEEIEEMDGLLA